MSFENQLILGLITGVFGLAYFVYGKKQSKMVPLISGIILMVFPYFVDSLVWSLVIAGFFVLIPLVYRPTDF